MYLCMCVYVCVNPIVEETPRSTVNCIIVEVFLLKIVLHYVPFKNQPDDPLKKLSIFFYLSCQIGYFYRKFKIFKKKIDGSIIKHLTLLKPVSNFFFQKKFFLPFYVDLKVKNEENVFF